MQGVLIASAVAAVRKSLAAIVGEGRTVHECSSASEALALAAAQRIDYIFIDDFFKDGDAEELISRLHTLGYGIGLIPLLLSDERRYLLPFQKYGVKYAVSKPFNVQQVQDALEQIEALKRSNGGENANSRELLEELKTHLQAATGPGEANESIGTFPQFDIREISQRFRRLVVRSLKRSDLIPAFAECLQEQFDVDNVVILLPSREAPCFHIAFGHVDETVREQFYLPLGEPFLSTLIRIEAPLWLDCCENLGAADSVAAVRCGERLGVRVLCPITSRGRLLAVVGLSRIHRYGSRSFLVSLLRLFFTFFAKALENADLYGQVAAAEEIYRTIFDVLPLGVVAVSEEGSIRSLNRLAADLLGSEADELHDQPVEKAGSLLADVAREVLSTGERGHNVLVNVRGRSIQLSAVPLREGAAGGALVLLQEDTQVDPGNEKKEEPNYDELMANMSKVLAHNFKNALVPVKTCAELLPERYENESFRTSFFEVVQESTAKIDRWINKLLCFSAGSVGETRHSTVALHEIIERSLERALRQFPHLEFTVQKEFGDDDGVNINSDAIEEIFFEIISNALDALQDISQPQLKIKIQHENGSVVTHVVDNGPGFSETGPQRCFEPFQTGKLNGLGLGLAFVKKTLELCNGRIEITPDKNDGADVVVVLPAGRKPVQEVTAAVKELDN